MDPRYAFLLIAMSMEEAKQVLGFPSNATPSDSEINKAWRQKAFEAHPDRGGDHDKMVEINVAKDILEGKQRPTYDRSSPSPSTYQPPSDTSYSTPRSKPKPAVVVTFDEAKSKAGISGSVDWIFVTGTQRGSSYSSDEASRSENSWVAYGRTDNKHVFVGMSHFTYAYYVIGMDENRDTWEMRSIEVPIHGNEGTEPSWLVGNVVKALKAVGFEGRFNFKVSDAKGWTFSDKFPRGSTTSIKNLLADTGQVAADDPRVVGRKLVVELTYDKSIMDQAPPDHYKAEDTSYDFEKIGVKINGKETPFSEKDFRKAVRVDLIRKVFGGYAYGGTAKQLTRMKDKGRQIIEWMAANMSDLPVDVRDKLSMAAAQMKKA